MLVHSNGVCCTVTQKVYILEINLAIMLYIPIFFRSELCIIVGHVLKSDFSLSCANLFEDELWSPDYIHDVWRLEDGEAAMAGADGKGRRRRRRLPRWRWQRGAWRKSDFHDDGAYLTALIFCLCANNQEAWRSKVLWIQTRRAISVYNNASNKNLMQKASPLPGQKKQFSKNSWTFGLENRTYGKCCQPRKIKIWLFSWHLVRTGHPVLAV